MKSIKTKLFFQTGLLVLLLVGLLIMANTIFMKPYYTSHLKNRLTELYKEINSIAGDYDQSLKQFVSMEANNNVDILIMSEANEILYTSNSYLVDRTLKERMARLNEMDGQVFHPMITHKAWMDEPIVEESLDHTPPPKRLEKLELVNDKMGFFYAHGDPLFGNKLLVLSGYLDSGDLLELKVPELYIDRSIMITNRFMLICGGFLFVMAMIFAYFLSASFTKPIRAINDVTRELSQLRFNKTCQVFSNDEIGELSESINHLSMELSKTIDALCHKNDELETLVHDVSHELKTPLALLQGYAEGIRVNVVEDKEKLDFYSEVIIDETRKMNRIVESLLDIRQLSSKEERIIKKPFSLNAMVHKLLMKLEPLMKTNKVDITFEPETEYWVLADGFRIEQVLMNYLTNAIQHTDGKEVIEIGVKEKERGIRLSVYNSSDDISDGALAHLWDKFYKVDSSRSRMKGGHGLGLSIVRAIQEAHGQPCGVYKKKNGLVFWADIEKVYQ